MKRKLDRGAAAVEFALVVPVLLLVVFAIIDFGRMLNAQLQVSEAAREGARAASVITGSASQRSDAARDRIALFSSSTTGGVDYVAGESGFCDNNPRTDQVNTVVASYRFSFITPVGDIGGFFGGGHWGGPVTLKATSVMPCRA
jgi:Flp pilus assembly protein TadG